MPPRILLFLAVPVLFGLFYFFVSDARTVAPVQTREESIAPHALEPFADVSGDRPEDVSAGDLSGRQAWIRDWAGRDPAKALGWLFGRDAEEQGGLAEAAWRGAFLNPDEALRQLKTLFSIRPEAVDLHGGWAVTILAESGLTERILALAETAPEPCGRDWTCAALGELAGRDPARALALWEALPEGDAKGPAWQSLASAWAMRDPAGLCRHAVTLPPDSEARVVALFDAAARWLEQDPTAYQGWLETVALPEEEEGFSASVSLEARAELQRQTEEALAEVRTMVDPVERTLTLTSVLEAWADVDAEAARVWISRTKWLNPGEQAGYMRATYRLPRYRAE